MKIGVQMDAEKLFFLLKSSQKGNLSVISLPRKPVVEMGIEKINEAPLTGPNNTGTLVLVKRSR